MIALRGGGRGRRTRRSLRGGPAAWRRSEFLGWPAMRFLPRRPLWRAVLGLAVVALGVVVARAVIVLSRPRNVSHPNVQFTAPQTTTTSTTTKRRRPPAFSWPWYGYSAARTRDFAAPADLHPPLHTGWAYHSG